MSVVAVRPALFDGVLPLPASAHIDVPVRLSGLRICDLLAI